MANFRAIGGGNVGVKYKTIATAAANQTYAQQMAQIKTTYDTLTNEEKKRCIISYGLSEVVFQHYSLDRFIYVFVTANALQSFCIDITNGTLYGSTTKSSDNTTVIVDHAPTTNSTSMNLMLLCNY